VAAEPDNVAMPARVDSAGPAACQAANQLAGFARLPLQFGTAARRHGVFCQFFHVQFAAAQERRIITAYAAAA
jgi:hypothetical protein